MREIFNRGNMMKHMQDRGNTGLFEQAMQMPLNKENLGALQAMLQSMGTEIAGSGDAAAPATKGFESLSDSEKKKAVMLQSVIDAGGFPSQSYLGNLFRLEHKKGSTEGDKYKLCSSRVEAAEFRVEWCKKQYKHITEKKTFVQSWKRVDRTKGSYRNFGRLVCDFGGWDCPEAIEGASNAVSKCMLLGHPWVQKHPQSGLTEYLVLQMEWEEEFESMWSNFTEHCNSDGSPSTGDGGIAQVAGQPAARLADQVTAPSSPVAKGVDVTPGTPTTVPPSTPRAVPKAAGKRSDKAGGSKPQASGKGDDPSPGDEKKKEFGRLQRESIKLKQLFHTASSNFIQMRQAIDTDASWAWATCGPADATKLAKLVQVKTELQAMQNDWHKEFLCNTDIAGIRKKYTPERVTVELTKFLESKIAVDKLTSMLEAMNRVHTEILNAS
jgi:hypothetical protein